MIKHLTIHLTDTCNLQCRFCHVAAKKGLQNDYSVDCLIKKRIMEAKPESISIAGGEPFFVRKRLYDFIDSIPTSIKSVAITTNGTLLNESDLKILKEKGIRLQFSIDGLKNQHDFNRGKGSFDLAIRNLKRAVEEKIRVDILTTVSALNIKLTVDYLKEIDNYGVQNITLLHFTEKGRGQNCTDYLISASEWLKLCYNLPIHLKSMRTRVWIQPRYLTAKQIRSMSAEREIHICNCHNMKYAYIDAENGNVYPCGLAYNTPLCIGSLITASLGVLVTNAIKNASIPKDCESCKNLEICYGGAKCYSWMNCGNIESNESCLNTNLIPICPFPAMYIAGPKMNTKMPTII